MPSPPAVDPALSALFLDHVASRLAVIGTDGRYIFANREMHAYWHPREVIGQTVRDLIGDEALSRMQPFLDRATSGETVQFKGWARLPDRGDRYINVTLVPYRRPGETRPLVVVIGQDDTDLKRREQDLADRSVQLNASEALKSAIVDHAFTALVSADADGNIVEFNPAAERMFGFRRSEAIGRTVGETIIPDRYRERHNAGMKRMGEGGSGRVLGKRMELRAMRVDGTEFPMEMVLWSTSAGSTAFYTASIADLSARYEAAEQIERQREALRQSEKLTTMGSLLAGVAHELNNPLAIVMGRAGLLEEKCADMPALRADAVRIKAAAERCGGIVRTFLNLARNRPSTRAQLAMNDIVRSTVDMLLYVFRSSAVEVELKLAEGLPEVSADGDRLGQILMNLLINAQQVMSSSQGPRRVLLTTGFRKSTTGLDIVWLRVSDSGPGMSEAVRSRLFEPFFTTKADGTGTGLGLSMSRSLAREHGGDLVLEADAELGGASFELTLPQMEVASTGHTANVSIATSASMRARVLVVDDEPELITMMREMLEGVHFEVATAESGALALEMLETAQFDVIVSDVRMPDMDGLAFAKTVAMRHPRLISRILFVTGDTLSPDVGRILKAAHAVLEKPFSTADLLGGVRTLLN